MKIRYRIPELHDIIKNLGELLGVSILVLDNNAQKLVCYSNPDDYCSTMQNNLEFRKKCHSCDLKLIEKCMRSQKIEMHHCHSGLCDVAMPVSKNGTVVAYIIIGRIRTAESPVTGDNLYMGLTSFTSSQLENLKKLLPNIVFDGGIYFESDSPIDEIVLYIKNHLNEDLSIKQICTRFYISKNALYSAFAQEYNCTVKEFILNERINRAVDKLIYSDSKMTHIAEETGFGNYSHFSKAFKKVFGVSPSDYKKSVKP